MMKLRVLFALLVPVLLATPALARHHKSDDTSKEAASVAAAAVIAAGDRVVDPTERVGAITSASTEEDIVLLYGAQNVLLTTDGKSLVVFPGAADELRIDFHFPHRNPERVAIVGSSATWATASGLRVGVTVEELEKINEGPFDVTGMKYSIPGRVVSWKGGKLPPTMYVDLESIDPINSPARRSLGSNKTFFDSSTPALKDFVVRRIVLEW